MEKLVEEAERWDLEPNPARLRWSSTLAGEVNEDMTVKTQKGQHKVSFEKSFKILVYFFNQTGKTHESVEERMQKAHKAWWREMHRSTAAEMSPGEEEEEEG